MKLGKVIQLCDDVIAGLSKSEGNLIEIFNLANGVKERAIKGTLPDDETVGRLYGYLFLAKGFSSDEQGTIR